MTRARRFAFTQFNMDFDFDDLSCDFLIVGKEVCPDTGRQHLQCYVEFKQQTTIKALSKRLGGAHIEIAKGNSAQNIAYCSKEEVLLTKGEPTAQGKRNDLESLVNKIKENPTITTAELIEEGGATWCRNYRALEVIKDAFEPERNWVPEVHYVWGPSGSGKTRRAIEAGATKVWFKDGFFSGYGGEDIVVFDDIDEWTFFKNRNVFLELTDRYKYRINVKGGSRNWKPRVIYITSNYRPEETLFFKGEKGVLDEAVRRRLSTISEMSH